MALRAHDPARKEIPFTVQRLTEEYLDRAVALCDQCVGENLYPKSYIASILHQKPQAVRLSPMGTQPSYFQAMHRAKSAFSALASFRAEEVKVIVSEGGDQTEAYTHVRGLLNQLKREGEMTYLSLVTLDEDSVTFCDKHHGIQAGVEIIPHPMHVQNILNHCDGLTVLIQNRRAGGEVISKLIVGDSVRRVSPPC